VQLMPALASAPRVTLLLLAAADQLPALAAEEAVARLPWPPGEKRREGGRLGRGRARPCEKERGRVWRGWVEGERGRVRRRGGGCGAAG
jgi:hypothetical protein